MASLLATSRKTLASSALFYFQPFSASIHLDNHFYDRASKKAADLLGLESRELVDKYLLLANVFLAWESLKLDQDEAHFPVDDLDSLILATPQLSQLIHATSQPIISALILSQLPAELALSVLLNMLGLGLSQSLSSYSEIASAILWVLLLIPSGDSDFGSLLPEFAHTHPDLAQLCSTMLRLILLQYYPGRASTKPLRCEDLTSLGLSITTSQSLVILANTLKIFNGEKSISQSSSYSAMDLSEDSRAIHFPDCFSVWSACVQCQLHERSISINAWGLLLSNRAIFSVGGVEIWTNLLENYLLPLFSSQSHVYGENEKILLLQQICMLDVAEEDDRRMILEIFKELLLVDWKASHVRNILGWRLENDLSILKGENLAKQGLSSMLNSISDTDDPTIPQQLIWLSFIDTEGLLQRIVTEMVHNKGTASFLAPLLALIPTPHLRKSSRSLLLDCLCSTASELHSASLSLQRSLIQASEVLKATSAHGTGSPLLGCLDLTCHLCIPTLSSILNQPAQQSPSNSAIPASDYALLHWILLLCHADSNSLNHFKISFGELDVGATWKLLHLLLAVDSRLQASSVISLDLGVLFGLLEATLRCYASKGASGVEILQSNPIFVSGATSSYRREYHWISILKSSLDVLTSVRSLKSRTVAPCTLLLSDFASAQLPQPVALFLDSSIALLMATPDFCYNLVYASSLGGIIAAKVADRLQFSIFETVEKRCFLRHLSLACTLIAPRLSSCSFESLFIHLLLPIASWPEFQSMFVERNSPASTSSHPLTIGTINPAPALDALKLVMAGNRSGDVARYFSEINSFLGAVVLVCDLLVALVLNKHGIGESLFAETAITESNVGLGGAPGEAWTELVGKLLNVAIAYLGLEDSEAPRSDPLPLLSLLHVLLARLCLPISLELPVEMRNTHFTMSRLGLFFSMLTAEAMRCQSSETWHSRDTQLMRAALQAVCTELNLRWHPAGLGLDNCAVLWTSDGDGQHS